jgi:DNA-3-methyladenine glycosylase
VKTLPRSFFARPTLDVLDAVIGKVLVHDTAEGRTAGVIVEAEAYIGESDPACHAAPGPTPRNEPLYGAPGRAYVYLNYGIHHLVNAVTEEVGSPAAILIRALEPVEGIELMRARRARPSPGRRRAVSPAARRGPETTEHADERLCRGPGNLTMALGIDLSHNRLDLTRGPLRIEDRGIRPGTRAYSPRIGIRVGTEQLWRCHWRDHPCVSGAGGAGVRS